MVGDETGIGDGGKSDGVEDAGMMVSTAQFWHRCLSGCEECVPLDCAVGADY